MAPPAADSLINALADSDPLVRADAARLLGDLRCQQAVAPLLRYVTLDRSYAKVAGLHALAQIRDDSAVAALRPLVHQPNCPDDWYWYGCRAVQTAAAVALLALGDDAGVPFLTEKAEAGDDVFFCWFGPAILRIPSTCSAIGAIRSLITSPAVCEGAGIFRTRFIEPGVTVMAARTLGLLGDALACHKLQELLTHHSRYVRGEAAVSLLAAAPTQPHVAVVREIVRNEPAEFVKVKATLGLAASGAADVDMIANVACTTADFFDRAVAVEALGMIGGRALEPALIENLSHPHAYVRRCAIEALDRLAARAALPAGRASEAIRPLMSDPDPRVRLQATAYAAARQAAAEVTR